jgi:hypothetical protein
MNKETGIPSADDRPTDADAYFGLSEELFNAVNLKADSELDDIGNYLQKLHIKNHTVSSKEVIRDLFTDEAARMETEQQLMSAEDEILFEEIRDAVTEKDIIDLRSNLQSIAKGVSIHERSFEEIEDLIDGELNEEMKSLMMEEAKVNSALSNEIELHSEINSAIGEEDIMQLRSTLKNMMQHEYSHSRTVEEIDNYMNGELDEDALALFEDELIYNSGLSADINFHRDVDEAVSETDVMALRENLRNISREQHDQANEKRGIATPKTKNLFWYAAASVIVLMVVFTSLMRSRSYSSQQLYANYYQPYKSGESVSRSALGSYNGLNTALQEINQGKYQEALESMSMIPAKERDGYSINFYSGVAYQELGEYNRAIGAFSEVVHHGDNLLVEQSEWYIGLCYLRIDERQKALEQFRLIAYRKGFYGEQSNELLKQLE